MNKHPLTKELKEKGASFITHLMEEVDNATPCNKKSYPYLNYLPGNLQKGFILGHSARHLSKTSGAMEKLFESYDHGGELNILKLKEKIASALFTLLKMMKTSETTSLEIIEQVEKFIQEEYSHT